MRQELIRNVSAAERLKKEARDEAHRIRDEAEKRMDAAQKRIDDEVKKRTRETEPASDYVAEEPVAKQQRRVDTEAEARREKQRQRYQTVKKKVEAYDELVAELEDKSEQLRRPRRSWQWSRCGYRTWGRNYIDKKFIFPSSVCVELKY